MKGISLLSTGIDSPVAAYILSSYLNEIIFLHVDGKPFTDDFEINNFITISQHLSDIINCKSRSYIIPHGKTLEEYKNGGFQPRFCCVFCKRMMVRYAEAFALKHKADFIIMGDSLGQVASQTLANILVIDNAINIPIIRPLIGFDKEEIIKIAKKIGTFSLSIKESVGCLAVPKKPATKASIEQLIEIEEKIPKQDLVNDAIRNIQIIRN